MMRLCVVFCLVLSAAAAPKTATLTGWFADEACAPSRLTAKELGPNNPECTKRCLEEGKAAVFISEQGREILKVKGYAAVKDDLGYHVELTGTLDEASKTLTIQSVKRLEYTGAQCARPRKKSTN